MKPIDIARICHEAMRAYCLSLGEPSQHSWEGAPEWQRESALNGVLFHLDTPDSGPEHSHESWLKEKYDAGWIHGPVKDAEKKQHPCMVPFADLPKDQQFKDVLFLSIVKACAPFLD